jgi:hypothetical protein
MSNEVKVGRKLVFGPGVAGHRPNIEGPMLEEGNHLRDDFTGVTLDSNKWATSVPGTMDSIAISEVAGGECLITVGSADNDSAMLSTAIIWNGTIEAKAEARVLITDVSGTGVFVGFSDAKSESNNSIAIHYAGDSLTTEASTAVGFVIDADHATSSIMLASVDGDSDGTPVDTGVDWEDTEVRDLRVELDASGNATFYIDGTSAGYIASAVTAGTLLCFTVQAITRANDGSNTVRVRRVDVWGNQV